MMVAILDQHLAYALLLFIFNTVPMAIHVNSDVTNQDGSSSTVNLFKSEFFLLMLIDI